MYIRLAVAVEPANNSGQAEVKIQYGGWKGARIFNNIEGNYSVSGKTFMQRLCSILWLYVGHFDKKSYNEFLVAAR